MALTQKQAAWCSRPLLWRQAVALFIGPMVVARATEDGATEDGASADELREAWLSR